MTDLNSCDDTSTLQVTSHSVDTELSKVRSFDKQTELFNILHSEDPCHNERLYLVGFLKFVGYSLEEICNIIDKEAAWNNYDASMTFCQVSSVFRGSGSIGNNSQSGISSRSSGAWIKRDEWNKKYNKAYCGIRYTSCSECPDFVDKSCMWVRK